MLDTLAVANYRSLRRLVVPLRRCTVVTGSNGSGKSSLYRSLVTALRDLGGDPGLLQLAKQDGQTVVEGQVLLDEPAWHWPGRG